MLIPQPVFFPQYGWNKAWPGLTMLGALCYPCLRIQPDPAARVVVSPRASADPLAYIISEHHSDIRPFHRLSSLPGSKRNPDNYIRRPGSPEVAKSTSVKATWPARKQRAGGNALVVVEPAA